MSLLREAAGGLSTVTPSEAPLTESPGEALPMSQEDLPPPNISMQDVSLVRGVVSSGGGGGSPYTGRGHSVRHYVTDQLRVSGVSYEPSLPPLSALSPTSFLFPSSDSGFVSLYSSSASLSSRPPSCAASSASASFYTSSFTPLSSYSSASSFSLPPLSSVLSPAVGVSAPPPPSGFPPLPPGFPHHSSSSSLVSSSFSTPLSLSSSSLSSSSFLPSSVSSSSAPVSSSPLVSSASSSSFSSLDYASYKAHVLGISDEYLSLARWYVSVGGSDFFSFISSHCPHLSADVAKDFASGSSVLLSTLRSSSASVSGPPGALPSSLFSSAVPPGGGVSSGVPRGVAVAPAAPVSSAGFLSSFLSVFDSRADPTPLLAPPLSSSSFTVAFWGCFGFCCGCGSCPLSGVPPPPPAAPLGSSFSSAAPGPSFAPSRPDPSFPDDSAFDPDFADPSAQGPEPPLAPPVPNSVHAEIRRIYSYVVDLFPQAVGSPSAPPPPRALFEDFFVASSSSSPHQPVFLDWFARVRMALSEADARLASLLASGRPDTSLLPQRMSQYAVDGDFASSSAVPVNPSLLSMFERSLRPSLQLGISLREAVLMESSSRFHSEALSHSLWLLSALLAFVRLQGFSPSDASLFNTLVTSLSKCLAHQASLSASLTVFLGLKRHNFYLSHLTAYFSEANKRAMLAAPVVCASSLFAE